MGLVVKANLISSPGFLPRYLVSLAVIATSIYWLWLNKRREAQRAFDLLHIQLLMAGSDATSASRWFSGMGGWSVMALLSSACCLVQVVLNLFSLGCAGFNTWLGPMRPIFLATTTLLQCWAWWVVATQAPTQWPYVSASSSLVLSMSFLPEVLHMLQHRPEPTAGPEAALVAELTVGGMGCVSCAQKIQSVVEALSGVGSCRVSVEQGTASVALTDAVGHAQKAGLLAAVLQATREAGFEASLKTSDDPVVVGPSPSDGWLGSWGAAAGAGLLSSSCCLLLLPHMDM